jgi:hypothetical protein
MDTLFGLLTTVSDATAKFLWFATEVDEEGEPSSSVWKVRDVL